MESIMIYTGNSFGINGKSVTSGQKIRILAELCDAVIVTTNFTSEASKISVKDVVTVMIKDCLVDPKGYFDSRRKELVNRITSIQNEIRLIDVEEADLQSKISKIKEMGTLEKSVL